MGFWVSKEAIWLRVKAGGAWDGVLGGCGDDLAQGEGEWGLGWDFC
jgi:hypothetical protein